MLAVSDGGREPGPQDHHAAAAAAPLWPSGTAGKRMEEAEGVSSSSDDEPPAVAGISRSLFSSRSAKEEKQQNKDRKPDPNRDSSTKKHSFNALMTLFLSDVDFH